MNEQVVALAARWYVALQKPDADWDGFTLWLEADPAHRKAYDEIALVDDLVEQHRIALDAAAMPFDSAAIRSRGRWRLLAVAAVGVLALVVSWNLLPIRGGTTQTYTADAGAARRIDLRDGSTIDLAASSVLTVTGRNQEHLTLEGGAYFDVRHAAGRTMVIESGEFQVRDIGTRFEIATAPHGIRVAVSEGELAVTSRRYAQRLPVTAGQQLLVSGTPSTAEYSAVATGDVASWRAGRLVFQDAPLSQVVAEISRHSGVEVVVDPQVADRRFSGVLTIGDGTALVGRLEEIMGLRALQADGGVRLVADSDQ